MQRMEWTPDRATRHLLCVISLLLGVIAVELGVERLSLNTPAQAQIPDTGRQRQDIVDEARKTNELLHEILDHLRSKAIKVEIKATDKRKGAPADRP